MSAVIKVIVDAPLPQRQPGHIDASSQQMALELSMTGKERLDYLQWKAERERIDADRLKRSQRTEAGTWKREWDTDKKM